MAMPAILEGDVERICDGMSGNIQAKIMSAVQDVEIERFLLEIKKLLSSFRTFDPSEIKQLPASAQERMDTTGSSPASGSWSATT